jgi:transcription elongation GreA/GreB family factor
MPQTVDLHAAKAALDKAWANVKSRSRPPAKMQQLIETVLSASDVTFKYILVTGYLAKYVNPKVHARALQAGSSLTGAYDARSVCHKVVVGFEKSKGNLFGMSNEPFLSKPARHPEHDRDNPQLRNKLSAQRLHAALEQGQRGSRAEVYQGLVHILRVSLQHTANRTQVEVSAQVTLGSVIDFVHKFLQETDGGARLVGVWGAFAKLLSEKGRVKVYPPSASDLYGKTAGDVEVYYADELVSASECKQRAMNLDDVKHGIGKAVKMGVPEYNFVISAGLTQGQEVLILETIKKNSRQVDLSLVDIRKEIQLLAAMLNPIRRAKFGAVVADLLRQMRKFESANAAAQLWNSITA